MDSSHCNSLVAVLSHEHLMESLEAGDHRWDFVFLRQDRASDVPCSRNLCSTTKEQTIIRTVNME